MPDAIIGLSAQGEIDLVNGQAEQLFGWASADLIGRAIEVLLPGGGNDYRPWYRPSDGDDPRTLPRGARLELTAHRRDGSEFPVEISISAQHGDQDDLLILAVVRDISANVELEAERQKRCRIAVLDEERHQKRLGQWAGVVAHDVNNLLGVILNYTALIESAADDRSAAADLRRIRAAVERGAALTQRLLIFARRDVVHAEPLDVAEAIRGIAPMLVRTLGDDINLRLQFDDLPLIALADPSQLQQVVLNLALNARDAMPVGGALTIMLGHSSRNAGESVDDVTVRVVDTGAGMTPDAVARAFEPFFTTKEGGLGSGLGLATVDGIVRGCGGEVALISHIGHGTMGTIQLPGWTPAASSHLPVPNLHGTECVLLVDDEVRLRLETVRMLRDYGYDVVACDGLEARELFDSDGDSIDIVVADVPMPRTGGDEFATRLAGRRPDLPVIFTSGDTSGTGPHSVRVLQKPVAENDLLRAIRETLDG